MNTERHKLTDAEVWGFVTEGCNAAEIAAYAGTSESVATHWIVRSSYRAAKSVEREAAQIMASVPRAVA